MKIKHCTILFILFLACAYNPAFATETRITQLFITDKGTEYRHTFLYNASGNIQLETKYIQSANDVWLRQSQTEWFYTSDAIIQQERVFENGGWKNTNELETRYHSTGERQEEIIYHYV